MWWVKLSSLETVYENVGWSIRVKISPEKDLKGDDKARGVAEGPHKRTGKVEKFQPKKEEEDERPEQQGRKLQPLLGSCFQGRAFHGQVYVSRVRTRAHTTFPNVHTYHSLVYRFLVIRGKAEPI